MVADGTARVARRATGRVLALALALAMAVPAPVAATAGDPAADETAEAHPLIFCTAPWPPFVETVPPPRPPSHKPDPVALGFRPAMADEGVAPADVPPIPAPVPAEAAAPTQDGGGDAGPSPVAGALAEGGIPLSEVEVVPPPAPPSKRLGRVMVALDDARRRSEASVVQTRDPAAESGVPQASQVAMATDQPEDMAQDMAEDASEVTAEVEVEAPPTPAGAPDPGAETGGGADAPAAPAAPPATSTGLSAFKMPTARALMPRGHAGGPLSEAVTAACREADLDCRLVLVPWMRPRAQLESGACDAMFPVEERSAARPYMQVSRPLVDSQLAFFTMNTDIHQVADLTEYIVLARGPSEAAEQARAAIEGLEKSALVLGPDLGSLIRRLSGLQPGDRVALYGNYHEVSRAMEDHDGPIPALNVVFHRRQPLRVGFSRESVPLEVIEAFNRGLKRIRETRELQEILDIGEVAPVN
ncbi:hypothetical protein [uncultured Rhodospira sp.]|uniref:hypothetical protein n=1 Tax=uncultured Rhodospira sp. TaxID=1936189 RepID=UPI00262BFA08|nr:hypothetical protein [uncultured Rhodospira sp.]